MKTYLARYWAVYGISLVAPALAACGDSGDVGTEGSTGTQGTTADVPTTGTATGTSGSTSGTTDAPTSTTSNTDSNSSSTGVTDTSSSGTTGSTGMVSASSTSGSSTTGADVCMTILCGVPAACCLDTEECVGGACLPICDSGVRCGANQETCCDSGDVCVGDACTTPGGDCSDSYDCPPNNYCEQVLGKCLPQPDGLTCEVKPSFDKIDVQLEWSWTTDEVIVQPLIADIQGDEVPEAVVVTTRADMVKDEVGEIVVLNGKTGAELWRIKDDVPNKKYGATGYATPVLGDVSGDDRPDIVYAGRMDAQFRSKVVAVDGNGVLLWVGHDAQNKEVSVRWNHGAAVMANLDNDKQAEIAIGGALFDHDGLMVWNQNNEGGLLGSPTDNGNPPKYVYSGGLATFADLTGDGKLELVTGREAWTVNWAPGNPPVVSLTQLWKNIDGKGNDGWTAIGDIDQNGTPEVVLVAWPDIKVLDGKTGKLWCGIDKTGVMCNNNDALRTKGIVIPVNEPHLYGPPTIADFDGDGRPEVGIAGGIAYKVFDFNRAGEDIVKPMNDPVPAAGAIYPRWVKATQDKTSACTGSSVFDFQGDGAAEVLYQDECKVYVYDGKTGNSQLEILNSSGTSHEYPLVADVDGDGNAEFLVIANLSIKASNDACKVKTPNFMPRKGVFSYGAGADNWVPTRKVWTQHTYHVTNADGVGNVPMMETSNWTDPLLNNFRQNVQGEGVFNAADLTASLAIDLNKCSAELVLKATIYNEGALGVPAGIDVTFYEGNDNTGLKLGTKPTVEALLTGGSTTVTWTVPAPMGKTNYFVEVDGGVDNGIIDECDNANNGALVTDAECPEPG